MTNLATTLALAAAKEPSDLPVSPPSPYFWLPAPNSTVAGAVDDLFGLIMWVSVISLVVLMGLMGYFVVKYRASSRHSKAEPSPDHHTGLELIWSIGPVPLLVAIFAWGFVGFIDMRTTPKDAYEIRVTAQKWKWLFEYPNGYTDDTLHVPLGRKVRVVINSVDVLHSLYFPSFRQKIDAVPGRYTELWFEATAAGTFPVFCTEYCGTGHSDMLSRVTVHGTEAEFGAWMAEAEKVIEQLPPAELGAKMYNQQGCAGCHTLDGSPKVGPSFKALFGKNESFADGTSATVDENYVRQSILEPQAKIVKGFAPAMPTYKGKLSDKKLDGLIAFIKAQN